MPPFCTETANVEAWVDGHYRPMLMTKSLCYDALIAA